jgi:hypothetical protein
LWISTRLFWVISFIAFFSEGKYKNVSGKCHAHIFIGFSLMIWLTYFLINDCKAKFLTHTCFVNCMKSRVFITLNHGRPQTFPRKGAKTYYLPKISNNNILFGPARGAGGGGSKGPSWPHHALEINQLTLTILSRFIR